MKNWLLHVIIVGYFLFNTATATIIDTKLSSSNYIADLKRYLQALKLVAIDFTQEDMHGNKVEGKLLINKPYKFRCNYYPPFPLVVIGNSNYVSVYDYDMKYVSRIKAQENIFNFLLENSQDFDKHIKFESIKNYDNIFEVTIYHSLTEKRSQIAFNKSSGQIKNLKIFEDDNIITINFNHIVPVKTFDQDLFKLKNPDIFGPPNRLTKSDIERKYILDAPLK